MSRDSGRELIRRVGRRVAELRIAQNLTQEALAERLDVALAYVARIEQGRQNVTLRTVAKLAETLGVEARELFDPPVTPAPPRGRPRRTGVQTP